MGMSGGGNSRKSRVALSEINVTPLVDVMLVLLIIFMVTAPMMQQGIEVNLPNTSDSGVETNDTPFILVISKDKKIFIEKEDVAFSDLKLKLTGIFDTKKNKQIYLKADKEVDYGFVAETMAEIRSAGITNISLITLPK